MDCKYLRCFALLTAAVCLTLVLSSPASAATLYFSSLLNGAQETPPVATDAKGLGLFSLDTVSGDFTFQIIFTPDLLHGSEIAAHIHGPAPVSVAAPVLFGLPLGTPKFGTIFGLTPAQQADLNAGLWYVNIHSTTFPGGEIRGQIIPGLPINLIVPEPSTLALAGAGLVGLAIFASRRRWRG
jgi:hypothetical protein